MVLTQTDNYPDDHSSGGVKGIIVQNGHKSMKLGTVVADNIINYFRYLHT